MNNNLISNIKQYFLTNSNIQLNDNWLKDCLDHINKNSNNNNNINLQIISEKVYKYFLNSDILKSALPNFTEQQAKSINDITIKVSKFNGVFILQLNSIKNISESFENRDNDDKSANRTLKLHLTDGKNNFNAIEHHFIHFLSPLMPPGLKIAIKDFTVRRGIILLEEHNIRIIGGQVTRLVKIHEEEVRMRKDKLSAVLGQNNNNNNNNNSNKSNINNRNLVNNNNNNARSNILPVNNINKPTTTSTVSTLGMNRTNMAVSANIANTTPSNLIRPTIPLSNPSTVTTSTIRPTLPIKPSTSGTIKRPPLSSSTTTTSTTTPTTTANTINQGITKDIPISLLSPPQSLITNRLNLLNDNNNNNNENSRSSFTSKITSNTTTTTTTTSKGSNNDHSVIYLDDEFNGVNRNDNDLIVNDKDTSFVTYISEINQKISIYKPKTKLNVLASIGGIKLSIKSGMFNIKLVLCDGSDSLNNVLLSPNISKSILGEVSDFRNLEKENQSKYLSDNLNLLANNLLELEFQNQNDGFSIIKIKPLNEKILIEQLKNDISSFQNDFSDSTNAFNNDPYNYDNGFENYSEYDY
ncbi:hypothetical protein ACTFIR_010374 [Dictyostelium discoideum]